MTEHPAESVLSGYQRDPRVGDADTGDTVERHVLACSRCRTVLRDRASSADLDRSWNMIVAALDDVDRPADRLAGDRDRVPSRGRRVVLVAACVALVLTAAAIVAQRREPTAPADTPPGSGWVDLGPADRFGIGDVVWFEDHRLFLVRTPTEFLALSQRSPQQGCRLVGLSADELIPDVPPHPPDAEFVDPCHGASFAPDGTRLAGPAMRGLYRYPAVVTNGAVTADLRLVYPGRSVDPEAVPEVPIARPSGVVDDVALGWAAAATEATAALRDGGSRSFLWPLGAFHDPDTDVVTVPFTVGASTGRLEVATMAALTVLDDSTLDVLRAQPLCTDTWGDTPESVVRCADVDALDIGYLNVVSAQADPSTVYAELYAPDGGERVVRVTLVLAPGEDRRTVATDVLLDIVRAHDLGAP
jgi:hypothetical protein